MTKVNNATNSNMHKARNEKNDEFYTMLGDIEKEMKHYRDQFKDKVVYCNCDKEGSSRFVEYFSKNFEFLGLKKLITSHYEPNGKSFKTETFKMGEMVKTDLEGNGDFRSQECIELLIVSDIVVSNPPFSLFREYIQTLVDYDKKFLIVGNYNAVTYKETFKLIKEEKLWIGVNFLKEFLEPSGNIKKFGNISWFTNMVHTKRNEKIIMFKEYNEADYQKYENFNAIEVGKVKDIPFDYEGVMGVPITFLCKYNPLQFVILGAEIFQLIETSKGVLEKPTHKLEGVNRKVFKRIWIKNRNPQKAL